MPDIGGMSKDSEINVGVNADTRGFASAMSQAERALHSFGGMLQNMGGIMGSVGSVVQGFASGGTMGAVTAAVNEAIEALQQCIDTYMEFETALVDVTSSSGLTGDALAQLGEDLQEAAMAAGVEFGVGATQAMRAMEALVKAGMEGEDAITALNASLSLARIEGMNTAEASNLLIGVLNMYSMTAEDAAHATDVLVNASIAGIGTAAEFAKGLSYVGGRAAQLGFSLEETTAALVALNNQGIEATSAGQSLNMMFTQMIQKGDELGFSMYDAQGNMLSLAEIMGNLTDKLNSMATQEERNAYLTDMFGARAGKAAAALLNLGDSGDEVTAAIMALTEGVTEGGTALDIMDQKGDTLAATQDRLNAIFENMQITVGEALAPVLEQLAGLMESTLIPAFEFIMPILSTIIELVGGLINFFVDLATVIGHTIGPALEWLGGILKPIADGIKFVADAAFTWLGWIADAVGSAADAINEANDAIAEGSEHASDTFADEGREYRDMANEHRRQMRLLQQDAEETAEVVTESFEEMSDDIADAMDDIFQSGHATFDQLVGDINSQIQQGLLGDAQDAIHDFVDCSMTKQADMIEEIDGYLTTLGDEYRDNMAKIRDLQARGLTREAELLMKRNNEITAKMDQLLSWRNMLVDQSYAETSDALRDYLNEQYGMIQDYYGSVEDLMPDPIFEAPIIEPIERLLDLERTTDPIRTPLPDPGTTTLASVTMEFTGDYTPQDAAELAQEVYDELKKIEEEELRARWL